MNKTIITILMIVLLNYSSFLLAQQASNYTPILPTDSPKDIIKKAANVTPSVRQRRWQELELTAFFHFGINTYTNREWGHGQKLLLDGNTTTHFTTKRQDTTTIINIQLKSTQTFDVLQLQENILVGQRIEGFKLDYWDKTTWKELATGTTVGYKRILRFEPVTTDKVRLHIVSSRLNPTISEFGLYKLPPSVLFKVNTLAKQRKPNKNNKAIGKPTQLATAPDPKYNKSGNSAWNNGIFGSNTAFNDGEWLGWSGQNFEGTIDFQKVETIKKVSIDFFNATQSWVYMPSEVTLFASDDGVNFKEIEKQSNFGIAEEGVRRVSFKGNFQAKYVKIMAKYYGLIPKGYEGTGSPAWLFVDEVVVE